MLLVRMKAKELIGQKVVGLDGTSIGEVYDLEIDDRWKVVSLVIRLEKDVAKKMGFRLSFRPKGAVSTDLVKGMKDFITIEAEGEELIKAIRRM